MSLTELSFTISGRISRPVDVAYEAVADPAQLSQYFTTGGAHGRLEAGTEVSWDFADFPGRFSVKVLEATAPQHIAIEWGGQDTIAENGHTQVTFEFEPLDDDTRTLVKITEKSWQLTETGARHAFGNCEGWTGMLMALRVWLEHGINVREGYYT